jgi:phenylalanyl-tRNA synthetase beta chain
MKLSYKWLSSLLPEKIELEELSHILTSVGLEVEDIASSSKIPGGLAGLVIGKVLTCEKHPNADKLSVTTVDVGGENPLPIVCGAPNVAAGQTVVVATVGTMIYPTKGEPFEIKKAKIRGEASEGMICAEDEIGLGTSHDGIIIIKEEIQAGTAAASYYNIPEADHTIEIGLTANRMDAQSHMGVAKDVCAYLSNKNNKLYTQIVPSAALPIISAEAKNEITITIKDTELCRRYVGAELKNVKVGASPEWLVERLQTVGVRSINNVVDVTNFILHETGQPLHAFDMSAIAGKQVIVCNAQQAEKFTTLDGAERTLQATDLMISNAENHMCIAGVFGGANSGVNESTANIFLESAWFNSTSVRKTSMHHGLRTDAAVRFEKGVDISQTRYALERVVALLCELSGAELAAPVQDIFPNPIEAVTIDVTYEYINRLSGANYSVAKIKNILLQLCFGIQKENEQGLTVIVPYSKTDISIPADVVEEIMRIDGLDNVPFTGKISFGISSNKDAEGSRASKEKVAQCLNNLGFHEIFTNSIGNSAHYPSEEKLVRMMNNLSAELDCMRPNMLPSGLQTIAYNLNRKNSNLFLYEIGKVYFAINGKYIEQEQLHLYFSGNTSAENWKETSKPVDVYYCKSTVEALLLRLGITFTYNYTENAIELKQKKKVLGFIEQVDAVTLKTFDVKQAVWHVQLDWQSISSASAGIRYTPVSKFQNVRRDLALVIDKQVSFEQISKCITSVNSTLLQDTNVFDVFESEKLGANKKSYAVSFEFGDAERTLTDADVDAEMNKLQASIEKGVGAEIRR